MLINSFRSVYIYLLLKWIFFSFEINGLIDDNYRLEKISRREHGDVRFYCDLTDVAWWKRPDLIATRSGTILKRFRSRMTLERDDHQNQSQVLHIHRLHSKDSGIYECETLGAIRLFHLMITVRLSTVELGAQIISTDDFSLNQSSILSNGHIDLRENQVLRITCAVGRARPAAYLSFSSTIDYRIERNSTIENEDQTYRTVLVVIIRVNRSHDQRSIHCQGNQNDDLVVRSNQLLINVAYSPQCSSKFLIPSPIYTGLGRLINLTCHMINGNPSTNNFTWHLPNGRIVLGKYFNSTSSSLSFVPKTTDEFGPISCRAENALGLYDQCQLKMSLGGSSPDPIQSCHYTYLNSTLTVNCLAGFHQGDEEFFCYMYKRQRNGSYSEHARLKGNCAFILPELNPADHHDFRVFTKNKFGDNFEQGYSIEVGKPKEQSLAEKSRHYLPYMAFFILGASIISMLMVYWSWQQIKRNKSEERKTNSSFDDRSLTFKNPNSHHRLSSKANGNGSLSHFQANGKHGPFPTRPYRSKDYQVASEPSTLHRANGHHLTKTRDQTSKTLERNSSLFPLINPVPLTLQRRASFQTATQLNSFDFPEPIFSHEKSTFDSSTNERRNYSPFLPTTSIHSNGLIMENHYFTDNILPNQTFDYDPNHKKQNENFLFHHNHRDEGIFV